MKEGKGGGCRRESDKDKEGAGGGLSTEGPLVNRLQVSGFFGFVGLSSLFVKLY
jgi:hypothetical protein